MKRHAGMRPRIALMALLALCGGAAAQAPRPGETTRETVLLCFEDTNVHPWRARNETGLNFTMLEAVAAKTGLRFDYEGRPWRRCHDDLRTGRVDGTFGMSHTPERDAFAVFPEGHPPDASKRMFEGGYVLVRRRGTAVDFDGERITGLDGPLGTEPATSITQDLRRRGYTVDDAAPSPRALLRKLAAGRLAAAAIGTDQMIQLRAEGGADLADLEVVPTPLVDKPYFLAFSKRFVASHPLLAERIWEAIAEVRESEYYRAELERARSGAAARDAR